MLNGPNNDSSCADRNREPGRGGAVREHDGAAHRDENGASPGAACTIAVVLVLAGRGQPLLAFFGITIASFKVGGAILILLLAISMMHATPTGEKQTPEEAREAEKGALRGSARDSAAVRPRRDYHYLSTGVLR
jgi:hypothetical protein